MEHYREREEGRTTTSFWVRTKTSLEIQKQVELTLITWRLRWRYYSL